MKGVAVRSVGGKMSRRTIVFSCICLLVFRFGSIVLAQQAGSVSGKQLEVPNRTGTFRPPGLDAILEKNISLPPFFFNDGSWDAGANAWFHAEGTWAGNNIFPVSTSHLDCDRREMQCEMTTATVTTGRGWPPLLWMERDFFKIETWTTSEIVTKADKNDCLWTTLGIKRKARAVSRLRVAVTADGGCELYGHELALKVGQAFTEHLDDGAKLWVDRASEKK